MRVVVAAAVLVLSASFLQGSDDEKDKNIEKARKDVKIKVTFPKEATFSRPKAAGGEVGKIVVKVEITNISEKPVTVSSANFSAKVKGLMGGVEKLVDAFQLEPGKTVKQDRTIVLHTVLPNNGDLLEVEFYAYGHKSVGKVKAKVK